MSGDPVPTSLGSASLSALRTKAREAELPPRVSVILR
jgi:hypothetical protein